MSEPTADDLALAEKIAKWFFEVQDQPKHEPAIAAIIAKHRQPPPAPQRDAWYVPDLTRAWLARERPELVPHAEWLNGQFQLAFNKGKQIGEGNVREQRDREWASSPAMTIEEQMAEIDEKLANTPGIKFQPLKKLDLIRKGKPSMDQSPPGWEVALRKILDDIRVAARVDDREFRLKSIDQLVAAIIAPKGPTP